MQILWFGGNRAKLTVYR